MSGPDHSLDSVYVTDTVKLDKIKQAKAWTRDPRYYKTVRISAIAAMKMLSHAKSGVEKGRASKTGLPIEIMGLMVGEIDTEHDHTVVVTDVVPLPVEGTETMVLTDKEEVLKYMIDQSEILGETRGVHFNGWYHSHPFDVGVHSNCFLSQTDVSTQLSWQINEDLHGNPWVAIVVDPLRSIAKGRPELGAFRCYPVSYTPDKGMAPDGIVWEDESARNARWGQSCVAYYQMEIQYFMSTLSFSLLEILSREFLWTKLFTATPSTDSESRERVIKQVATVSSKIDSSLGISGGVGSGERVGGSGGGGGGGSGGASALTDASQIGSDVATEAVRSDMIQVLKQVLFNRCGCAHHHK